MSAEVFISYAAKDRERVAKLVEGLQQAGVSVWIDMAGIEVVAMWSKEIVSAIRECKVLLLSISPQSTESENVVKELALASERVPIVLTTLNRRRFRRRWNTSWPASSAWSFTRAARRSRCRR